MKPPFSKQFSDGMHFRGKENALLGTNVIIIMFFSLTQAFVHDRLWRGAGEGVFYCNDARLTENAANWAADTIAHSPLVDFMAPLLTPCTHLGSHPSYFVHITRVFLAFIQHNSFICPFAPLAKKVST
jgi:hypothetical protein